MRPTRLLCLALGLLVSVTPAPAQLGPHEKLPGVIDRAAAEKRLAERFRSSAENSPLGMLEQLIKNPERYGIKPDDIRKIAAEAGKRPQDFGIDLTDPKFRDMARRLVQEGKFNPDQIENLRKVIPDIKPPDVKPPDMPPDKDKLPDKDKPPDVGKPPNGGNLPNVGGMPPIPPGGGPPPPPPGVDAVIKPETHTRTRSNDWFSQQFRGVREKVGFDLRDKLRGLLGSSREGGESGRDLFSGMRQWTRKIMPSFEGVRLDRFLRDLAPRTSMPRPDLSFNGPSFGRPSSESLGAVFTVILLVGVLGLGIYLIARSRGWVGDKAERWRLGPWPIAPGAVRTRSDLVLAFEYLALLLLGRDAASANHVDIARRIGADERRRHAAAELAELYEQARYAPPEESLGEAEMEQARRDLRLLAGGAAA